ncbi:hypothetical protein SD960_20325, partial [Flavobacterium sp. MMLR14_040]|uniref:hypothetical protein n=1 Tax=Flavobacterium sp. MMLR14_040 TaxID=3093843 RepID=UPI00298F9888
RVVKPACADGTAVMWESMSSPFFEKPYPKRIGFFVYKSFSGSSRKSEKRQKLGSGAKVGD